MAGQRRHRAGRILIGIGIMIVVAATPFLILSRYAGGWGVPYFTFTTSRGSTCTNDFTGYHCDDLTLADVEWWGDVDFPAHTVVVSSHYKSTNEFTLDAELEIPAAAEKSTAAKLTKIFGGCVQDHPTTLNTDGLTKMCVRANDASDPMLADKPMSNTLYVVTTAYRHGGGMVVGLHEASR
ncbi:MAG: hypothetical protein J2P23_10790 [Microlunatus sp.]|nr:hypothetical protein [Microlunatus sp.]